MSISISNSTAVQLWFGFFVEVLRVLIRQEQLPGPIRGPDDNWGYRATAWT